MKRLAFLFVACCLLAISCSSSSGGDESYALNPGDLSASGATTYAASLADVVTCLSTAKSDVVTKGLNDKLSADSVFKSLAALNGQSIDSSLLSASALSKVRNSAARTSVGQGRSVATASLDLSGEKIGDYFLIEKGATSYKLTLTTSDNDLLNLKAGEGSNLTDFSLTGTASILLKGQNLPSTSIFKSLVLNADVTVNRIGVSGIIPKTEDTRAGCKDLVLDGNANVIFGCSINSNGLGGKIILTAQATENAKVPDTTADNVDKSSFLPSSGGVTLTVYNDNNVSVYSKKWDSITDFYAALAVINEDK